MTDGTFSFQFADQGAGVHGNTAIPGMPGLTLLGPKSQFLSGACHLQLPHLKKLPDIRAQLQHKDSSNQQRASRGNGPTAARPHLDQ